MSPPAPNKSLRHQADRTGRTRRLRRSGAPKDRCVRTGSPSEGASGFSASGFARPGQPRAAGSVTPAPPRSPSRSAQPPPPPRRLGHLRSPLRDSPTVPPVRPRARAHPLWGALRRVPPRRAQAHRQVGGQFFPVGWLINAAAPGSPPWRLRAATPRRRIPRGTASRSEAAALLPAPGRRGRPRHP